MMDGRDSVGRKISLLNDSAPTKVQLPPLQHSRTSSCQSTPSLEPQTPLLIRSSSSDSRSFSTPSPLTPTFTSFPQATRTAPQKQHQQQPHCQNQQQYYFANTQYSKMDDQSASMYPPLPDPNSAMPAYPMPQMPPQQAMMQPQNVAPQGVRASGSPSSEPSRMSNASAQSGSKSQPKKNQYPCPMAKQVGCTDFFTTSGHAARHAKKHTGKKDAFCPECNKAFTRKDNMEQHRRTHQNRGASRSSNDDSKVKKNTKQTSKKPTKVEPQLEAAVEQQLADQAQAAQVQQVAQAAQAQGVNPATTDPAILMPASGPYFLNNPIDAGPIPSLPMPMNEMPGARPSLHRSNFTNSLDYVAPAAPMVDPDTLHYSYPSPGLSNGLNSLALAASEYSRMSEKHSARSPSSGASSHETL